MRKVFFFLLLAAAFAGAAVWQRERLGELRAGRLDAVAVADGALRETPAGLLEPGRAVLLVGAPSGAEPYPLPEAYAPPAASIEPAPAGDALDAPGAAEILPDFQMAVQPGQSLTRIAELRYGSRATVLVRALADYNGLADPDQLEIGQPLWLPEPERLGPAVQALLE